MAASASFSFDDGIFTSSCMATLPLRMRVSMSAMGSVIVIGSPTRLRDAGDLARVRHVAEADAAEPELAIDGLRSPALPAAGVAAHLELGLLLLLLDQSLLRHYFFLPLCCWGPRRFFLGGCRSPSGPSSPGRRNGKPNASRNALPSSFVVAVVTMVMSMPRVVSILS